jgi:hypothetical protein
MYIFPLRYYSNCVSTMLTVLITLKMFLSFIVTLYFKIRTEAFMLNSVLVVSSLIVNFVTGQGPILNLEVGN